MSSSVLFDVRDTDKRGIYSSLSLFSLLVSPKGSLLAASRCALILPKDSAHKGSLKWNAKKYAANHKAGRSLEGSGCFVLFSVSGIVLWHKVLLGVLHVSVCVPARTFKWGCLRKPWEIQRPFFRQLLTEEGVALNDGDRGQEILPVPSASVGKEQEGCLGWCVCMCCMVSHFQQFASYKFYTPPFQETWWECANAKYYYYLCLLSWNGEICPFVQDRAVIHYKQVKLANCPDLS